MARERRFTVLFTEDEYTKLALAAAEEDVSLSEYIRKRVLSLNEERVIGDVEK